MNSAPKRGSIFYYTIHNQSLNFGCISIIPKSLIKYGLKPRPGQSILIV